MAKKKPEQPEHRVKSTCPYCGVGCEVEVGVKGGKVFQIRGDKSHPANFGKLCPKPVGLPEALSSPDRLTRPFGRRKADGTSEYVSCTRPWARSPGGLRRR